MFRTTLYNSQKSDLDIDSDVKNMCKKYIMVGYIYAYI